jgi:hypothetical protein
MSSEINATVSETNQFHNRIKQNLKSNWRRIVPSSATGVVALMGAAALLAFHPAGWLLSAGLAATALTIGLLALGYTVIQLLKEPTATTPPIKGKWVVEKPPASDLQQPLAPIRYPAPAPAEELQDSHEVPPPPPPPARDNTPSTGTYAPPTQRPAPERISVSKPTTWPGALAKKVWDNKIKLLLAFSVGGYFLYPYLTTASAATAAAAAAEITPPAVAAAELPASRWFRSMTQITSTFLLGMFLHRRAAQA